MLIKIYDWLFTRKIWTVIKEVSVYESHDSKMPCGKCYVVQDQLGNIKKKTVRF